MIEMKHININGIPTLELFMKGSEHSKLPLVIFYHGWESRKERVLEHGYYLASNGFRAVLPEAFNHGERKNGKINKINPIDFWSIVRMNIHEFPLIVDYYLSLELVNKDEINVAGLSFGGITTSALLTQFDWIHSAAILMGSPSPKEFSLWTLKQFERENSALVDKIDKDMLLEKLQNLNPISLDEQPAKIANRPLYVWHGMQDPTVPFHITSDFIENIKAKEYSKQLVFEVSEDIAHEVPKEISLRMTEFLREHSNNNMV